MNKNDFDAFCPKFPTFSNKQQHYDCDALRKVSHSVTQPSALLLSKREHLCKTVLPHAQTNWTKLLTVSQIESTDNRTPKSAPHQQQKFYVCSLLE